MPKNPASMTAVQRVFILGVVVLCLLAGSGVWNVRSLVNSADELAKSTTSQPLSPGDREQQQRTLRAMRKQVGWLFALMLGGTPMIVGLLWAASSLVRRELSQRLISDQRLRERESRLKAILDSEPECVKLIAEDGTLLEMNAAGLQMIEAGSASQVIGHQIELLVAPEFRHDFQLLNERVFRGEAAKLEYKIIGLKGGQRWMETHASPLRDETGRVVAQIGITQDITERKRAKEALQASETMLELVLDSIPQGVFWKDRHSVYLGANRVVRRAMGLEDSQPVVGMTDFDSASLRPAQAEFFVAKDREVMESDQPQYAIEEFMTLPNGTTIWLETNKIPFHDSHGNVIGILGTWEDITARKQANEALRDSRERLAALSRQLIMAQESERRHVARELHDEIGQVLTAVGLKLHHLKEVCGSEAATALDGGVDLIDQAMTQVRNLSLNLRPPMLDVLGLDAAVRSCVEQHRQQTGCDVQLNLQLEGRLSPDLEITCYRVIQNALTNVARHAHASQVSVDVRQNDLELEVLVRDNGIGLDLASVRQRLDQGQSFGILAMQERVQLMGGTFRIDSVATPGVGTSVHAHFPLETSAAIQW